MLQHFVHDYTLTKCVCVCVCCRGEYKYWFAPLSAVVWLSAVASRGSRQGILSNCREGVCARVCVLGFFCLFFSTVPLSLLFRMTRPYRNFTTVIGSHAQIVPGMNHSVNHCSCHCCCWSAWSLSFTSGVLSPQERGLSTFLFFSRDARPHFCNLQPGLLHFPSSQTLSAASHQAAVHVELSC